MAFVRDILTNAQIAELRALQATALAGDENVKGLWRPVYDKLYEFITVMLSPYFVTVISIAATARLYVIAAGRRTGNRPNVGRGVI